ncbi:MmcQ/YjbR family DNA-binding protein [Sulfurospirillum diekertiae]|uniref:MmcQ/YjbR family DNA-binding protein n=2 Tax=Sulfurospirillum diekertiae TaxID=1854492 RepID=A0A6G9VX95_9BACT|nr:MmcQ/YjbR family DNA-binding protein [Sulfurospirillum diekertiae]QIR79908.1 MmcQ/YjbR family DNA-binding protein [Sulfurospirillum diekertiae]
MTFEILNNYCLSHIGAIKEYPFDNTTAVYKVGDKIFALIDEASNAPRINLKCDPYYARELREMYENVIAGYHMNKRHWNTVICEDEIDETLVFEWIDDSYDLVFNSLSKKLQNFIRNS